MSWLNKKSTLTPIAIHFGGDAIRMMQLEHASSPVLHSAVEIKTDSCGIAGALSAFRGRQCILGLPSTAVLVQHLRVPLQASETEICEQLVSHDTRWGDAEIRTLSVTTSSSGSSGGSKQELLCLGVDRKNLWEHVEQLEEANAKVVAVTVPIYASIRAFDHLNRRSDDGSQTFILVDFDDQALMAMIAHGGNCVFANKFISETDSKPTQWEPVSSSIKIPTVAEQYPERRGDQQPRGLHEVEQNYSKAEQQIAIELKRCLRHHDALFPDQAIDRIIFSGHGANDSIRCADIATQLGIAGYIADPSAWIAGSTQVAGGPAWTTVAGMCLRYTEKAA